LAYEELSLKKGFLGFLIAIIINWVKSEDYMEKRVKGESKHIAKKRLNG